MKIQPTIQSFFNRGASSKRKAEEVDQVPKKVALQERQETIDTSNSNPLLVDDNPTPEKAIIVSKESSSPKSKAPKSKAPTPKKPKTVPASSPVLEAKKVLKDASKSTPATFEKTDTIEYGLLCSTFEKIESTTKRLIILDYLKEFFGHVIDTSPNSLIECVYLCLNKLGPEYEGQELGIGESLLIKAIASTTGRSPALIKKEVEEKGDLGLVAQASKGKQMMMMKPKSLTVKSVFESLKKISNFSGTSSQQKKVDTIGKMLISCSNSEPKYLIRSLEGKLRIGLAQQTVLIALTHAAVSREKEFKSLKDSSSKAAYLAEAVAIVKQVFSEIPTYDKLIPALLKYGHKELPNHCQLSPGIPLKPMLAHPTKSLTDVLNRFENIKFTCEYKYDGERAQIHLLEDGTIMVYSRNSENLSAKYPDIINRMQNVKKEGTTSFVLDCEAVAWDVKQQCILPFQVLSTRKRKDVQTADIQVQVCVFAFDLLYLNGEALVKKSLSERRELLKNNLIEVPGEFEFAKSMESNSVDDIQHFLDASITDNCEGLMVKTLDKEASYEPSKRSRNWLKVKKDYLNGMGDSLDLVVIGGFIGRGKRTGTYGGYLLACYNDETEEYQSICKIGTGFSDENLLEHHKKFQQYIIDSPDSSYVFGDNPNVRPDVWFSPAIVWEVKAADLSISPVHMAGFGLVDPNKGISLRFPRFIRERDDKKPNQATTAVQVSEFYNAQNLNTTNNSTGVDDDFEF
ncbi:ATP-dependent DNA ligase [Globomyces pollinis-pini]|nr:ATP-dependent DNA ligase [Globomyces pollinis-pini]